MTEPPPSAGARQRLTAGARPRLTPSARAPAADVAAPAWTRRERRLVRDTARIGAWGILLGSATLLTAVLGAPWPNAMVQFGAGLGLATGGLYTAFASGLLLLKARRMPMGHLKLGALLSFPFGLSALVIGAWWLYRIPALTPLVPTALWLFVLLGALLLAVIGSALLRQPSADPHGRRRS